MFYDFQGEKIGPNTVVLGLTKLWACLPATLADGVKII